MGANDKNSSPSFRVKLAIEHNVRSPQSLAESPAQVAPN